MTQEFIPFPHRSSIIAKSSWTKKKLADVHVEALLLCQYKCKYCSSNAGRHLKTRPDIAESVQQATGRHFNPHDAEDVVITFQGIVEALEKELSDKRQKPGAGETLVYSQLTDGFSPVVVQDGTTRRILELLIEKTDYRIRILTKNAIVGTPKWIEFFQRHQHRFVVGLSIGTQDDQFGRRLEVGASVPSARIRAMHALQEAGVPTFGMLCPVFPEVLEGDKLEGLMDAIRLDKCDNVWAEPYNDRQNWRYVRECFETTSPMWNWMTQVYDQHNWALWSKYTTDLFERIRDRAMRDNWIDRLYYLLYEKLITDADADRFQNLNGVLLQSKQNDNGLSCHSKFAMFQTRTLAE